MGFAQLLKLLSDEWSVIAQAPLTFGTAAILLVVACCIATRAWYRHQVANAESTAKNQESMVKLKDAELRSAQDENKKLKDDLVRLQPQSAESEQLIPVTHGNDAVQSLFRQLVDRKRVPLPTHPTDSSQFKKEIWDLSAKDFEMLAAARRLVETGFGEVDTREGRVTLSATAQAMGVASEWKEIEKTPSTTRRSN